MRKGARATQRLKFGEEEAAHLRLSGVADSEHPPLNRKDKVWGSRFSGKRCFGSKAVGRSVGVVPRQLLDGL